MIGQKSVTDRRWFSCRWQLLSVACISVVFSLSGCAGLDKVQPQIQGGLQTVQDGAQTVANVSGFISPSTSQVAQIIAAITGALLTMDKLIEKSRTPSVSETTVSLPQNTPEKGVRKMT